MNKNNSPTPDPGSTAPAETDATALSPAENGAHVDKIRDILFGNHMRDYDKRFSRTEEKLAKETADLRDEIKRRFAALEAFVKGELSALNDRLKTERDERAEALKELARELKESNKGWERKTTQLEDQLAKNLRELRQQLLEESKRLSEEMEQIHQDAVSGLGRESQELRASMVDRMALADLLAEVSLRLKKELTIPQQQR